MDSVLPTDQAGVRVAGFVVEFRQADRGGSRQRDTAARSRQGDDAAIMVVARAIKVCWWNKVFARFGGRSILVAPEVAHMCIQISSGLLECARRGGASEESALVDVADLDAHVCYLRRGCG